MTVHQNRASSSSLLQQPLIYIPYSLDVLDITVGDFKRSKYHGETRPVSAFAAHLHLLLDLSSRGQTSLYPQLHPSARTDSQTEEEFGRAYQRYWVLDFLLCNQRRHIRPSHYPINPITKYARPRFIAPMPWTRTQPARHLVIDLFGTCSRTCSVSSLQLAIWLAIHYHSADHQHHSYIEVWAESAYWLDVPNHRTIDAWDRSRIVEEDGLSVVDSPVPCWRSLTGYSTVVK